MLEHNWYHNIEVPLGEKMKDRKYPDKETILTILKAGAVLTLAMLAPGAVRLFKDDPVFSSWQKFHQPLLRRNITRLKRKGLVTFSEEGGETVVKITDKGKIEILKYNLDKLEIRRPDFWDRKWRIVVFDIPEEKKEAREFFRKKLKELEFYQFQESVFIFPFPCEKEIKFLREIFEVPDEVKIILAQKVENEDDLREMFGL